MAAVGDAQQPWVPYSQRPEWADVTPDEVADADGGIVAIQYSAQHRELLGYWRAVMAKGERSARMLDLTADLIAANSADYTAWQVRWELLEALGQDLAGEYNTTQRIADECAKNYQLWNHRRKLARALGAETTATELAFCKTALDADAKNYHAWAHRQVIVAAAGAWGGELAYVEALLAQDVRNNSAWNQRAWVLQHTLGRFPSLEALRDAELEYVAAALARAPDNESAWNYLWGLFALPGCRVHDMGREPKVFIICREALSDSPSCKPALDTLAQYYACLAAAAAELGSSEAAVTAAGRGLAVLDACCIADPIKCQYWRHRRAELAALLEGLQR